MNIYISQGVAIGTVVGVIVAMGLYITINIINAAIDTHEKENTEK